MCNYLSELNHDLEKIELNASILKTAMVKIHREKEFQLSEKASHHIIEPNYENFDEMYEISEEIKNFLKNVQRTCPELLSDTDKSFESQHSSSYTSNTINLYSKIVEANSAATTEEIFNIH